MQYSEQNNIQALLCQTCKRQKEDKEAISWCIQCKEEFCEKCVCYHKALTLTKEHVFLNLNEYKEIATLLKGTQETCAIHGQLNEYFCQSHDVTVCLSCKDLGHESCKDNVLNIKTNMGIKQQEKVHETLDALSGLIDLIDKNRSDNLDKLERKQREVQIDLHEKKKGLQDLLRQIEDSQITINQQFDDYRKEISSYREALLEKRSILEDRRNVFSIAQKFKSDPATYFLSMHQLAQLNTTDENDLREKIEKLTSLELSYSSDFKIEDEEGSNFTAMLRFKESPSNILITKDHLEASSSTVEDEIQEPDVQNLDCSVSVPENKLVVSQSCLITCIDQDKESEKADSASCMAASKESNLDQSKKTKKHYRLVTNVMVEKSTGKTAIRCASILHGGEIIIGESSNPRLLIYKRHNKKLASKNCEIKVTYAPESIVVVDSKTIAYSAHTYIALVEIIQYQWTMKQVKKFNMDSNCFGLAFCKSNIVVNCEKTGIKVLTLTGDVVAENPFVTGILYMTSFKNGKIFYVQKGSTTVHTFNIKKLDELKSPFGTSKNLHGANGITTDDNDVLFVSCDHSKKIYCLNKHTNTWSVAMIEGFDIGTPWNVYFDTMRNELLVVSQNGRSISIFKESI